MSERHGMIPGSHERPHGPECFCGADWDWWNDVCTAASDDTRKAGGSDD